MTKLHELLAAEKTPNGAWNALFEDTMKKFKNPTHFYEGHSKSLSMIEDTPQNKNLEAAAHEEKAVPTNVFDTLEYALDVYAKAENLQYQKNATNRTATADVKWKGEVLFKDMPIDELLGLEARLTKIRQLYQEIPTLDAAKHWEADAQSGNYVYRTKYPEETTKTEKTLTPVTMKEATKEHPAQVQAVTKDVVVGKYTTTKRSGAATATQKSEAIKQVDELLIEIKQARMRANETVVVKEKIADKLVKLLLDPLK
jgi:hypothetical protein